MLTAEQLRAELSYCPTAGIFKRLNTRGKWKAGSIAGCIGAHGYVQISVMGKKEYAHRLAILYVTGEWPAGEVDHLDHDKTHNAIANLRDVPPVVNKQNVRTKRSHSQQPAMGIYKNPKGGKFVARISVNGSQKYLGTYDTHELAHLAYLQAKRNLHQGNTL